MAWSVPIPLGSGDDDEEEIFQSLLDAYACNWDTDDGKALWSELRADAWLISMIWQVNRRVYNQVDPDKMVEALPNWERAMSILPRPSASLVDRRRPVAARFKAAAENKLTNIEQASQKVLGAAYNGVVKVADADVWWWMPGVKPGPPEFPFASNRLHICVHMIADTFPIDEMLRRRAQLLGELANILPAYMIPEVGIGDGTTNGNFISGIGIAGYTIL